MRKYLLRLEWGPSASQTWAQEISAISAPRAINLFWQQARQHSMPPAGVDARVVLSRVNGAANQRYYIRVDCGTDAYAHPCYRGPGTFPNSQAMLDHARTAYSVRQHVNIHLVSAQIIAHPSMFYCFPEAAPVVESTPVPTTPDSGGFLTYLLQVKHVDMDTVEPYQFRIAGNADTVALRNKAIQEAMASLGAGWDCRGIRLLIRPPAEASQPLASYKAIGYRQGVTAMETKTIYFNVPSQANRDAEVNGALISAKILLGKGFTVSQLERNGHNQRIPETIVPLIKPLSRKYCYLGNKEIAGLAWRTFIAAPKKSENP